MFIVPLSIRNNLNFLARFSPKRSKIVILKNTLCVLLWNDEYIELVAIPLLAQAGESSVVKALFVIDAAITVREDVLHIFAITKTTFYHFVDGLNTFMEIDHSFSSPEISAWGNSVVIFSNGTFYSFDGNGFRGLRISPYFSTIKSYSCGHSSGNDIVLYQTEAYTSAYTLGGASVLKKHPCTQRIFISDGKLFVHDNNEIFMYEISKSLKLVAKININVKIRAEWKHLRYHQEMLYMSGVSKSGYVLYVDGYLFTTEDLVQSFEFYRNCFFGVGTSSLYFLPNDGDFDLRLLESEHKVLDNVLSGNPTPYVCRTFNSLKLERPREAKDGVEKRSNIGYFLSVLVYHGFKIECRKLICNALNDIQKNPGVFKRLRVLNEAAKFGYKIYKVFMNMKIDVSRIYEKITEILDPGAIDEDLLVNMIEVSFRDVNFINTPRYFLLKGKKLMEQGEDFMELFYKCTGIFDNVVRVLEDNNRIVEVVLLWKKVGFCSGDSFEKICRYNLVHFVLQEGIKNEICGKDVMECLYEMWSKTDDRYKKVSALVNFINGRYDLIMSFSLPSPLKPFLSSEIVKRCYKVASEVKPATDFLLLNGMLTEASSLYYHQFINTGNKRWLSESLKNIHDAVFVYDNGFVGKETLDALMEKEKVDYKAVILENIKRIKEMKDGCIWTDVIKAETFQKEYSEYIRTLNMKGSLNFS